MNNNTILKLFVFLISVLAIGQTPASAQVKLLVPMEPSQTNHLKAYGIAYRHLLNGKELDWLLNYRGGAFLFNYDQSVENECRQKNVSYELLNGTQTATAYADAQSDESNTDIVRLEKVARIAVYVPPNALPWDDAVQLVLEYAEIPYEKLWDDPWIKKLECLRGHLK